MTEENKGRGKYNEVGEKVRSLVSKLPFLVHHKEGEAGKNIAVGIIAAVILVCEEVREYRERKETKPNETNDS